MDDEKIIAMYWQRDENAINETQKKYHGLLFSLAENLLANNEDSEECVSDTYLSAWNSIPEARPDFFRAFLSKITRNLSLKKLRSRSAEKRGKGEGEASLSELAEVIPAEKSLEDKLEAKELAKFIDIFLREINETDRNLFLRRYFYFEPIKDIALNFGFTDGKVKTRLRRTRMKLYGYLEKEELL